jgi:hypothetical protein
MVLWSFFKPVGAALPYRFVADVRAWTQLSGFAPPLVAIEARLARWRAGKNGGARLRRAQVGRGFQ